jgi:hypothetical protein
MDHPWSQKLTGDICYRNSAGQSVTLPLWEQLVRRADYMVRVCRQRWESGGRAWAFPHLGREHVQRVWRCFTACMCAVHVCVSALSPRPHCDARVPATRRPNERLSVSLMRKTTLRLSNGTASCGQSHSSALL